MGKRSFKGSGPMSRSELSPARRRAANKRYRQAKNAVPYAGPVMITKPGEPPMLQAAKRVHPADRPNKGRGT